MSEVTTAEGTATPNPEAAPTTEAPQQASVTSETTPDVVKADAKPTEQPQQAVEPKPTEVEIVLELSDDSPLEDSVVTEIATLAKEKGLTQEQAKVLLEREDKAARARIDEHNKLVDSWKSAVSVDKEIGGEKYNESVEHAKRVVQKYGSDAFKQALDQSGLGNHPELVRFVSRIGRAMADDSLVKASSSGKPARSIEDILYGSKQE